MSHYEVYRLLPDKIYDELRYRPFRYLKEHHIKIRADIYEIIAKEPLDGSETVKEIRDRLEQDDSVMDPHPALAVSDVIAVTKDGLTFAYYVDPTRLILIPDFFSLPSSAAVISLDTTGYMIEGRKGTWMTVDAMMIDGRMYFLMLSEVYKRDAPYMILDPHGTLIGNDPKGFTDESIALIRETVKQAENRKAIEASLASGSSSKDKNHKDHSESANYLRNAEMSEEQNYNMIDGMINNTIPADNRKRSVLKRLHEKQEGISFEHDLNERTRQ